MNRFFNVIVVLVACFLVACRVGSIPQNKSKVKTEETTRVEAAKIEAENAEAAMVEAAKETGVYLDQWDSILIAYEMFVDHYIELLEKVSAGEAVMTQAMKVLEQINTLSERFNKVRGDLTDAQNKKLSQLQKKFADAVTSM